MDLPDSSDYWEEVAEQLQAQGIAREDVLAISAVTGQGVLDLVRRLRAVLDSLPAVVSLLPNQLSTSVLRTNCIRVSRQSPAGCISLEGWAADRLVQSLHCDSATPLQDEAEPTTNALNMTEPPKGLSEKRIDEFTITTDLANGRLFFVEGEAIERFAGMTNWDYYEAQLRFQKVLEASGASPVQSSLESGVAHAHKKAL